MQPLIMVVERPVIPPISVISRKSSSVRFETSKFRVSSGFFSLTSINVVLMLPLFVQSIIVPVFSPDMPPARCSAETVPENEQQLITPVFLPAIPPAFSDAFISPINSHSLITPPFSPAIPPTIVAVPPGSE